MAEETKSYEIGYLVRGEEGSRALLSHLKRYEVEILFESEVRSVKLSYPIAHLSGAHFGFVHFKIDPEKIGDLKDALKLDNEIIRFLIITPPFAKERSQVPGAEPPQPKRRAVPVIKSTEEIAVSNDLLEEKLEEILNK